MATLLAPIDCVDAAVQGGFSYGHGIVIVVAIGLTEAPYHDQYGAVIGADTQAVFVNSDQWSSRDRGWLQINDHWHPDVTDAEAFDPVQAAVAAFSISKQGSDFSPWATYGNGSGKFRLNMPIAWQAYFAWYARKQVADLQSQLAAVQAQLNSVTADDAAQTAKVASLQSQLDTANATLASTQQQLSDVAADRDSLKTSLANETALVATYQTAVTDIRNTLSTLA